MDSLKALMGVEPVVLHNCDTLQVAVDIFSQGVIVSTGCLLVI